MDKEIIDKVMFDNFLRSVPTMVVDAKDRKTISAYGSIGVDDLRSAIDIFKKVPDYGELLEQCKKQKEVIDKITSNIKNDIDGFMTINDYGECNNILDLLNIYLDILNEVTNNE